MISRFSLLSTAFLTLTQLGCVRLLLPTSVEEQGKMSHPPINYFVSVNYIDAYINLKRMYEYCVDKNTPNGYIKVYAELSREERKAHFNAIGTHGTYLFRVNLEHISDRSTKISVIRSKSKFSIISPSIQDLQQDADTTFQWAAGTLKTCR